MIFILLEASTAQTKFEAAFGRTADSLESARDFMQNLGRYLGIKTVVSMATGVCAGVLTWSIGLDFPLLWAMLAFLLNYVPTIGSIIAAVPAVLLALVQIGPGAAGATARRRHFAARRVCRTGCMGVHIRPGRHAVVCAADHDTQDGARE
jgi:predicted PurR-regulated permease PerM